MGAGDDGGAAADGSGVMAGHGFYAHHAATQGGAAARGIELLQAAIDELDLTAGSAVRVADLGCAQGHNSLPPLRAAVGALAGRDVGAVDVVHTDLPTNDWATLFDVLAHDPGSYLAGRDDVHAFVVGRSFYERLVGPASIHLAWTSSTLHWLSAPAGPIADHFFVQSSTDGAARDRYRSRSAADWSAFLAARSVELVPTASVVFVDVLMGDDGRMGSEALFDVVEAALRAARDGGTLRADEYAALAYPTWFRTLDELRAPFAEGRYTGPTGATLALAHLEPVELADPFLPAFHASGDAGAYARSQTGFLRGFLEPSFGAALADRDAPARRSVLDGLFADVEARLAVDPGSVSPTYRLVTGRIRRSGADGRFGAPG